MFFKNSIFRGLKGNKILASSLICALGISGASLSQANELDVEQINQSFSQQTGVETPGSTLKGTTVLRVDTRDGSTAVLTTDVEVKTKEDAMKLNEGTFTVVSSDKIINKKSELDKDGGLSSWHWYNPYAYGYGYYGYYNYGYPQNYYYNYYGYSYSPWFNIAASFYSYYYYNPYYSYCRQGW